MESFLLVMQIIALAAVTALCVYLIAVLVRVRRLLETIEHDFKELSTKAIPVLENLEEITDKIKSITETIGEQVDTVKHSIGSLRDITDSIAAFEQRVQEHIEEPVINTIDTIASILKGFQNLISRLPFISRLRVE
jgi:uncharacterized protein YoxC